MRKFHGAFLNFDISSVSISPERYAPSIEVNIQWEDREKSFDFLIDTGAEVTLLFPGQAQALFGSAFSDFEFDRSGARELVAGIDGVMSAVVPVPVNLNFHDEVDAPEPFHINILVVQPNPPNLDDPDLGLGNWDNPSLLGRDLLLHFDLFVSGSTSEVYLSLPD